jgi:hypothetical protein
MVHAGSDSRIDESLTTDNHRFTYLDADSALFFIISCWAFIAASMATYHDARCAVRIRALDETQLGHQDRLDAKTQRSRDIEKAYETPKLCPQPCVPIDRVHLRHFKTS